MKKLFLLIMLLGTAFVCRSQDFLNNQSFVCGVGATDDEALVSLAKSIQVSISAEQTYRVSEYKNKIGPEQDRYYHDCLVLNNEEAYVNTWLRDSGYGVVANYGLYLIKAKCCDACDYVPDSPFQN